MPGITRRTLFKRTSVGATALGALIAMPHVLGTPAATAAALVEAPAGRQSSGSTSRRASAEPIIAHVRDTATGEIAIFAGTREIIVHDVVLVSRLLQAGA